MKKPSVSASAAGRALSLKGHASMTPEQRSERARKAVNARWAKKKKGAAK